MRIASFLPRSRRTTAAAVDAGELVSMLRQILAACGGELVPAPEGGYEVHLPEPWNTQTVHVGTVLPSGDGWVFVESEEWKVTRKELAAD